MTMIWTDDKHIEELKAAIKSQQKKLADMQDALDASYKALTNAQCDLAYDMSRGLCGQHLLTFRFSDEMLKFEKHAIDTMMNAIGQKLIPYIKDLQEKRKNGGS